MGKKQIFYGITSIVLALILLGVSGYVYSGGVTNDRDFALGLVMGVLIVIVVILGASYGRSLRGGGEDK